jgi:hypothetical protein
MNVAVLTSEFPSSSWRRAFASALIRLHPELNPDAADELADAAYPRLANLDPDQAAALHERSGGVAAGRAADGARWHMAI